LDFLLGLVFLHRAMLVAVEASGGKVAQIVRSAIHKSFLVFDSRACRPALRELAAAIAAQPALDLNEMAAHPRSV
jgi:hypothetical protein